MDGLIALTGATGYIGGRLLDALEARGARVRCLSRRPEDLAARVGDGTEVVPGDVLRPTALLAALEGVETAYYLVHSMGSGGSFSAIDRRAATAFGRAARAAGVRRIVYLGGLGEGDLSEHLASRQEVGRILRESGVPTIEFRASIVIGPGSASFEMLRALVERLPVMVTPRWVGTRTQPIAIEDVLAYLLAALDYEPDGGEVFEIGGADVCSYLDLMHAYADRRGLRRHMVPVPVLTPRLSSLWLHLVTPVHAGIGRELVESLRTETVVRDPRALEVFSVRPRTSADAVARALAVEDAEMAETRWTDPALSQGGGYGGVRQGSRLIDSRSVAVARPPAAAFAPIQRIGGDTGWYAGDELWQVRGAARRARRRAGPAARAPRSGRRPDRRRDRLLARRGLRAGPAAASGGGDEDARPGVAPVRGRARRAPVDRRSGRRPSSILPGSPASRTGTRSGRCTTTSSAPCSGRSPPPRPPPDRRPTSAGSGASPWRGPPWYSALIVVSLDRGGRDSGIGATLRRRTGAPEIDRTGGFLTRFGGGIAGTMLCSRKTSMNLRETAVPRSSWRTRRRLRAHPRRRGARGPRIQLGEITLGRLEDVPHDQLGAPAAGDGVEEVGGRDQHQTSIGTRDSGCRSRSLESLARAIDATHDALKRRASHPAPSSRFPWSRSSLLGSSTVRFRLHDCGRGSRPPRVR